MAVAGGLVYTYVLGIPAATFHCLWTHRYNIHTPPFKARFGALVAGFEFEHFYFGLADILRKVILAGGMVLFTQFSATQMVLGIGTCLAHTFLLARFRPHTSDALDGIATLLSGMLLLTYVIGMAVQSQNFFEVQQLHSDGFDTRGFGVVLVVLNSTTALGSAAALLWVLREGAQVGVAVVRRMSRVDTASEGDLAQTLAAGPQGEAGTSTTRTAVVQISRVFERVATGRI